MTPIWIAVVVLWVVVVLQGVLLLGLVRRGGAVLERAERLVTTSALDETIGGVEPGTDLERFEVRREDGVRVSSEILLSGRHAVLFLGSDCEPCQHLMDGLAQAEPDCLGVPTVAVLEEGTDPAPLHVPDWVDVVFHSGRAARAFQNHATPQAFLVEDGVVLARRIPGSFRDLQQLSTTHAKETTIVTGRRRNERR